VFGWIKQSAWLRQIKARGRSKAGAVFRLHVMAYNLIRITNLLRAQEVMAWRWSGKEQGSEIQALDHVPGPLNATEQPLAGSRSDWRGINNAHKPTTNPALSRFFSSLLEPQHQGWAFEWGSAVFGSGAGCLPIEPSRHL
jgi:hypothetical protein